MGLITSELGKLRGDEEYLSVYIPTTPVPSSGFLVVIPVSEVTPTDISVDEAMRMIISGGILAGDIFSTRAIVDNSSWPGREWALARQGSAMAPPVVQNRPEPEPVSSTEPQD